MASTPAPSAPRPRRRWPWLVLAFGVGIVLLSALAYLLTNIAARKAEAVEYPLKVVKIGPTELDPAVWGKNFPREYNSFVKTKDDTVKTPYGGSVPYNKLEAFPALKRIWAGYAFSVDYNEERGHAYALIDQKDTKRQVAVKQPAACANCHAAEAPLLIEQMGWEEFNGTPYTEISGTLHTGTSCQDCHNPDTMELWISRPAFKNAMEARGIDLSQATRQEMRTYVCAQCHVEYYFKGDQKVLTFPWSKGLKIEEMYAHYEEYGFKDWAHKETAAPMLKTQHPEFEMWSSGLHARSGVACADCHMPYVRDGAVKVSDHWLRSPLTNINQACQTCHKQDEQALKDRITIIQNNTAELLRKAEAVQVEAIDAINAAKAAGATDDQLKDALQLQRKAAFFRDFVAAENSTGFHSPQEAARVLANAIDAARQAQLVATKAGKK
ncbi:MAG: ammonia-forming cytochrome c nitrite reductase subunit c552 [Chloroflexi bacterium]|nr:ammonia-forming cytochrome c nitrite reductase subunit c552 [Chloroflexota bacterium]